MEMRKDLFFLLWPLVLRLGAANWADKTLTREKQTKSFIISFA